MANEHFKRRISELRSAQKGRKEGRTLRTEIEDIIREARSRRHFHNISKGEHLVRETRGDMRDLGRRAKLLKKEEFDLSSRSLEDLRERANAATKAGDLARLPEFSTLSADEWFEKVVWPELQRIEATLRSNPLIGELKKANKSGKFQLSDLKTQARTTVMRIAALPRPFYFW